MEQVFLYPLVRLSGVEARVPIGAPFDSAQGDNRNFKIKY